jgi:hypothetical protein
VSQPTIPTAIVTPFPFGRTAVRRLRIVRRGCVVVLLTCFSGVVAIAHADAPPTGGWAVVATAANESDLEEATARAAALEAMLRVQSAPVVGPDEVRARFIAEHSTESIVLDDARLRRLRAHMARATRAFALGNIDEANAELAPLRALSDGEQDELRREEGQAQELFDLCVVAATQTASGSEDGAAERQMQECVRAMPTLRAAPHYHSPEARALYIRVTTQLERGQPSSLVIRSASDGPCQSRINGAPAGAVPTVLELVPTEVRLQVECGARRGRTHRLPVAPGFNEITIDPEFDAAVRSDAPRLRLVHSDPRVLDVRRTLDAAALARALRSDTLLLVEVAQGITIRQHDRRGSETARVRWNAPLHDRSALERAARALFGPQPVRSEAPAENYRSALPVIRWSDSTSWIIPSAIALGYSAAIATSVIALMQRANLRQSVLSAARPSIAEYRSGRQLALIGTSAGAAVATLTELLGLPAHPSVPWWGWTAGGLGLGAVSAAVLLSPDADCRQLVALRACTPLSQDSVLPALLVLHAVPLLTIPLTYGLSAALGEETGVELDADGAVSVWVRGRF